MTEIYLGREPDMPEESVKPTITRRGGMVQSKLTDFPQKRREEPMLTTSKLSLEKPEEPEMFGMAPEEVQTAELVSAPVAPKIMEEEKQGEEGKQSILGTIGSIGAKVAAAGVDLYTGIPIGSTSQAIASVAAIDIMRKTKFNIDDKLIKFYQDTFSTEQNQITPKQAKKELERYRKKFPDITRAKAIEDLRSFPTEKQFKVYLASQL
jgi:hypothetical protein